MNAGLDHEKEFSLIDFIKIVFKERFKISICVGIISLLTAGYTLTVDNEYESFAILVSSDKNEINSGQMSSLTSGIGALSILQGNVSENNLTTIALETIQSKETLAEKNELPSHHPFSERCWVYELSRTCTRRIQIKHILIIAP